MTRSQSGIVFLHKNWALNRCLVGGDMATLYERLRTDHGCRVHEVPTGTEVFDWCVPPSWHLHRAKLFLDDGSCIADTETEPLSLWTNSSAFEGTLSAEQQCDRLATHPMLKDAYAYNYLYYRDHWGFSLTANQMDKAKGRSLRAEIDTSFGREPLFMADLDVEGRSAASILITAHTDHPFQVADGLSGVALALDLAARLKARRPMLSYRFVFIPETIGSLAYFSEFPPDRWVLGGLHLDMVGINSPLLYQRSLPGSALIDRAAEGILRKTHPDGQVTAFRELPGNDEAVMNSVGMNVPAGLVMRWPFDAYHTSQDNWDRFDADAYGLTLDYVDALLLQLERDIGAIQTVPGLIMLSRHGLMDSFGTGPARRQFEQVLSALDGRQCFAAVAAANDLSEADLRIFLAPFEKAARVAQSYDS